MRDLLGAAACKSETTFNTAESLTTTEQFLAEEWSVDFEHDKLERTTVRDVADKQAPLIGGAKATVKGKLNLRGSGTAGSIDAPLAAIFKACGFTHTAVASYYDKFVPDADLDEIGSLTAGKWVGGANGKKYIAKGVRGNMQITFSPGKFGVVTFDGKGVKSSGPTDEATPAAPSDAIKPPRFVSANAYLLEVKSAPLVETEDAIDLELQDGAGSNVEFAINITGDGKKVGYIGLKLKKNGAPANETNGIVLEIQGDAAGDPDGTPITGGTSAAIATSLISTTGEWHWFKFASQPTLTDSTAYHIVVTGDYDTDADNNIMLGYDAVSAPAQICQFYDAAWAALEDKNINVVVLEATTPTLKFGDITLDMGMSVDVDTDPNDANGYDGGQVTDNRQIKITCDPIDKKISERDFYTDMVDYTDLAMMFTLGTVAGDRFMVTALHLQQIKEDTAANRMGQKTYPLELVMADGTDLRILAY